MRSITFCGLPQHHLCEAQHRFVSAWISNDVLALLEMMLTFGQMMLCPADTNEKIQVFRLVFFGAGSGTLNKRAPFFLHFAALFPSFPLMSSPSVCLRKLGKTSYNPFSFFFFALFRDCSAGSAFSTAAKRKASQVTFTAGQIEQALSTKPSSLLRKRWPLKHLRCSRVLRTPLPQNKSASQVTCAFVLVPAAGLEPARYCYQRILSPSRLPFHHAGLYWPCILYHKTFKKVNSLLKI